MATALSVSSEQNERRYNKNQIDVGEHKSNDSKNRLIECSFCQERLSSPSALVDHLMLCGNKTDQCPNCRKFIRRAEFAYHYENNCANLEDLDTPTPRSRVSSTKHHSSLKPINSSTLENRIKDLDKKSDRISSSSALNKDYSPKKIACPHCYNQCEPDDYKTHLENCTKNPYKINKKQRRASLMNERDSSQDVVRIPCEFCNEQIDLRIWASHTQDCRERENRRLKIRAETINREPIIEKLPCEHCQELFSYIELQRHEIICPKNPERMAIQARLAELTKQQSLSRVSLTNSLLSTERDPKPSPTYSSLQPYLASAYNDQSVQYNNIMGQRTTDFERNAPLQTRRFSSLENGDARKTQDILKLRENETSFHATHGHQPLKSSKTNDNLDLQLMNSSREISAYGPLPGLPTEHHSSNTQSLPIRSRRTASLDRPVQNPRLMPRPGSPGVSSSRLRSNSRDSRSETGSLRPNSSKATRPLRSTNDVVFCSPRDENQTHQPVLKSRGHSATTNRTKPKYTTYINPKKWK